VAHISGFTWEHATELDVMDDAIYCCFFCHHWLIIAFVKH